MSETTNTQYIALVQCDDTVLDIIQQGSFENREFLKFENGVELAEKWEEDKLNIVAVISQGEILSAMGINLLQGLNNKNLPPVPVFLIVANLNKDSRRLALEAGVFDVFKMPLKTTDIETRVNFTIDHWNEIQSELPEKRSDVYKLPLIKRAFDVFFAGFALLMLLPLFIVIYLLIRFESKGPVFYYSLRVGTGYNIFRFYKFRSMYVNADQRLKDFKHLNQYSGTAEEAKDLKFLDNDSLCDDCQASGRCQFPLYADNTTWCEKKFLKNKKLTAASTFFKLKNDPRITRVGNFIRNTSIDELPQLWNVMIGDMSIVGNRPLPLYEAEKLTTDRYALRFHAPAGITGLWQVEKRGKGDMDEEERLMLDNKYAENHSFSYDMKLILKTIPALLQKENV
ncbi:MAG TPA: sugar transferase [Mucilaginibacter sp.]|jgi:lipopolysaccharide/colanic/teichoic acid biosynthesis glycosyltransferase|nr:sugar transferase [Mucilaginibacter sp.]